MTNMLKSADKDNQSVVFGYSRGIEKSNQVVIPPLVTHLCVTFYLLPDYFERASDDFEISEDKWSVKRMDPTTNWRYTNYCHHKIYSMSDVIGQWQINRQFHSYCIVNLYHIQ